MFKTYFYTGEIKTSFRWIIPLFLGISKSNIDNKANVYSIHITPLFEIGINVKTKKNINHGKS